MLKIFNCTGVTINSRDVEACHFLNQPVNPIKSGYRTTKKKRLGQANEQQKDVKKYETSKYWFTTWL